MSNIGNAYSRKIKSINDVLAQIGGLSTTIIALLYWIEGFFGLDFRQLDFALSF